MRDAPCARFIKPIPPRKLSPLGKTGHTWSALDFASCNPRAGSRGVLGIPISGVSVAPHLFMTAIFDTLLQIRFLERPVVESLEWIRPRRASALAGAGRCSPQ